MGERRQVPTDEEIVKAEELRSSGRSSAAARLMRGVVHSPLEDFSSLPSDQQGRVLKASRIYVDAEGSLAKRAWKAPEVAAHLGAARRGIVDVYRNPQVQEAVGPLSEGPYDFRTEMRRDEVKHTETLAALTGNTGLLDQAIQRIDEAVAVAQEPTARTLAEFERERLRHRRSPTQKGFQELTRRFQAATEASLVVGNSPRVATVAARYTIDAARAGHGVAVIKGLVAYGRAVGQDKKIGTGTILPREVAKAATESPRQANWRRTTPKGIDYSHLALPER